MKDEDFKNLTAESLVGLVKKSHEKIMAEAEKREKELKEKVTDLSLKEKGLKEKIEAAKKLQEKMIADFEVLEKEQKDEISAKIKKDGKTREGVESGRITLKQFLVGGKKDDELQKELMLKNLESLEKASGVLRAKGEEIIRLERDLYEIQSQIHGLLIQPIRLLEASFKQSLDVLNFQFEKFHEDFYLSQALKNKRERQITMIETGTAITPAFTWYNISLKDAYRVRLDPVLPKRLIASLQEKLDKIEGGPEARVTIIYHAPGSPMSANPVEVREEL